MPYRAAITLLWLILVAYWGSTALGNKATAHRSSPVWRTLTLLGIGALFLLIEEFPRYFRHHLYAPGEAGRAAGIIVCAAGVAFAIWARHELGTNWSGNPTIKQGHELVVKGPYRLIRHPIYTGILIAIIGTGIGSGQVKQLFILGFAAGALWAKLRIEESLMLRQFPESYPGYKSRTKALIPFVL